MDIWVVPIFWLLMNRAMNITDKFLCERVHISLGDTPGVRTAGS